MAGLDWFGKLFQGAEQTRGLSGAPASAVAFDASNSFYNFRLRRHFADVNLVAQPARLWHTHEEIDARAGLGVHVADAVTDAQPFSDVFVVLSREDYAELMTAEATGDSSVRVHLRKAMREFLSGVEGESGAIEVSITFLCDATPEIGNTDFGLVEGEFITGIVPNFYELTRRDAVREISINVNLPGVWEGYQEVGHLHEDQALFTLGNHWLDNFSNAALGEAALYHLQMDGEGGCSHIINPDLQHEYALTNAVVEDTNVITITSREDGRAIAHIVLSMTEAVAEPLPQGEQAPAQPPRKKSMTIVPEFQTDRILALQERGALLQKVHFGKIMLGYDVFVSPRGKLTTDSGKKVASFQVRKDELRIMAHQDGVMWDGQAITPGQSLEINGDGVLEVQGKSVKFHDLRGITADGWPYVGEIERPVSSIYVLFGRMYSVGRARDCRVVLPDEPSNENIVWRPEVEKGDSIPSKNGAIPKANFYTDSIMVGSEHATLDLSGSTPILSARHARCYSFVRRKGDVHSVYPLSAEDGHRMELQPGDDVLVGNSVFHVEYAPEGAPDEAPAESLSVGDIEPVAELSSIDMEPMGEEVPETTPPHLYASPVELPDDGFDDAWPIAPGTRESVPAVDYASGPALANLPEAFDDEPLISRNTKPQPSAQRSISDAPDWGAEVSPAAEAEAPVPKLGLPVSGAKPTDPMAISPVADATPLASAEVNEQAPVPDTEPQAPVEPTVAPEEPPAASPEVAVVEAEVPVPAEEAHVDIPEAPVEVMEAPEAPVVEPVPKAPEAPPEPVAAPAEAPIASTTVVTVAEETAQFELSRPARLRLEGWVVKGTVTCGNHTGVQVILPENLIEEGQRFTAEDYFSLRVRGARASMTVLDETNLRAPSGDSEAPNPKERFGVVRRDDLGEEDFIVELWIDDAFALPDPRSRLLRVCDEEPLTRALFEKGFPLSGDRRVAMGQIEMTVSFDGDSLRIAEYLESYESAASGGVFFVSAGEGAAFQTAPEDGRPIELAPGARILVGNQVFRFVKS